MRQNKKLSVFLFTFCVLVFTACPDAPDNSNKEESPWSWYGLEGYDVKKLRLFDDQLYAITNNHGLFRRNIRLESSEWEYIEFQDKIDEYYGVWNVYAHPNDGDRILISYNSPDSSLPSLYLTEDFGETWMPIDSGLVMEDNSRLLPLELIGSRNTVYSNSWYGPIGMMLSSKDFGNTWSQLHKYSDTYYQMVAVHQENDSLLWYSVSGVFGGGSIYKSPDGGKTWDQSVTQPYCEFYSFDLILHPQDINMVYITCNNQLMKSEDGGLTWEYFWIDSLFYPNSYYSESLFIDKSSTNHLFMSGTHTEVLGNWEDVLYKKRLFESWDEGETWEEINIPDTINSNNDFTSKPAFDHTSQTFFFPTQSGVLKYIHSIATIHSQRNSEGL